MGIQGMEIYGEVWLGYGKGIRAPRNLFAFKYGGTAYRGGGGDAAFATAAIEIPR
jgi:hypothetical protein